MNFNKFIENIKNNKMNKNFSSLIAILLIGIFLVIAASFFKSSNNNNTPSIKSAKSVSGKDVSQNENENSESEKSQTEEKKVENNLEDTLEQINGVGRVKVIVYFSSGEEQVPAVNENDSTSTTQEKDNSGGTRNTVQKNSGKNVVVTNDGDGTTKPLIVKKYNPKVTGVFIVAQGAENNIIQLEITKAVEDLFDIPADKVNVYPMKK